MLTTVIALALSLSWPQAEAPAPRPGAAPSRPDAAASRPDAVRPRPAMADPALVRGRRVEIKGRVQADGSIEARRIRLRDPEGGSKIEGRVAAVDLIERTLVIGGLDVSLTDKALVEGVGGQDLRLRHLKAGDIVEAKGRWSRGRLMASRLRTRAIEAGEDPTARETEIEADLQRVDRAAGTVTVLGRTVTLAPGGKVADERMPAAPSAGTGRLRRDDDDQQVGPIQLGKWVTIGGRAGGEIIGERNFNRDADEPEVDDRASSTAELMASVLIGGNAEFYGRVRTSRVFPLEGGPSVRARETEASVLEASLTVNRIAGGPVGFQVGRQRFRDEREWFMDDYMDAVRLHLDLASWRIETAVASGVFAGPEETRGRGDQRHAVLSVTRRIGARTAATMFAIGRDDRNRREKPVWVGASVAGRATRALKYWGTGAVRRGRAGAAGETRLESWGADGAVSFRFPLPGSPFVSGGYAAASGDLSRSDCVDSTFRQTGLEDNTGRFHGLKRFAYYGEVFDPELSNIEVVTAGTGVRPFEGASIDVVYHRYRQREIRRSLPSNALEATGTGKSGELGDEFDVIVSVQRFRPVDFSIVAGIFRPGTGMASPAKPARYWMPQMRIFF